MALYEKRKEKLAQKITFLKERIKSDTAELNEAQAKYTELCFLSMKGSSNCDEQELADVIVQEHKLIQLLRDKGITDEQLIAFANGEADRTGDMLGGGNSANASVPGDNAFFGGKPLTDKD